jgi:hypothetical protein
MTAEMDNNCHRDESFREASTLELTITPPNEVIIELSTLTITSKDQ